jgi:hypothetical protein
MALSARALAVAALVVSLANVLVYQILPFVPRVGLWALFRVDTVRRVLSGIALALAVATARRSRTSAWRTVTAVVALVPLAGALHARRLLVPLDDPDHRRADDAALDGETTVLGVVLDGQAHGWQVRTLVPHHVVHDTVAGRPVVAAWCAVCNSGLVFDASVDGRVLHFDPEAVWRENMLMRDRETGTLWQHATGEALVGPLAGTRLDVLGGQTMTWDVWRADHPETTVTRDPSEREWTGLLPKRTVSRVLVDGGPLTTLANRLARRDDRLAPTSVVVGVEVAGRARAYPLTTLTEVGSVEDEVGGVPVVVRFDRRGDRVSVESADATPTVRRTRWLEWVEFHPETTVYDPESSAAR